MRITGNGPDVPNSLFGFFARGFARLGARVQLCESENLVRRLGSRRVLDGLPAPPYAQTVDTHVEICVSGLPNLAHEVGHFVARGVLDDDHGIDVEALPFELGTARGRALLWEEMACCTLACGYPRAPQGQPRARWVDAWFREQVEIQPFFFGFDDDVGGFWRAIARLYAADRVPAEAAVSRAYHGAAALLRWAGAPASIVAPAERLSFGALLQRARP